MRDPEKLEELTRQLHNRLRGRMAGFIEACGLPERQERSMISTMKSLSYDVENAIVDALTNNDDPTVE